MMQIIEIIMAAIYTVGNGIAIGVVIPIHGLSQLISQFMQ